MFKAQQFVGEEVESIRDVVIVEFEGAGTEAFTLAIIDKGQGFDTVLNACRFLWLGGHAILAPGC